MADYQKMYYTLFNAMSESCEMMLKAIHDAEAIYMDGDSTPIKLAPRGHRVVVDAHTAPPQRHKQSKPKCRSGIIRPYICHINQFSLSWKNSAKQLTSALYLW